jgi:hypothetical protein
MIGKEMKKAWVDCETWGQKALFVVAIAPLIIVMGAMMPMSYECPRCDTELVGRGHNCPMCGYAFTEKGELRNLNQKIDGLDEVDSP